ncbi:phosphotriesterase [Nocardioides panacihumi]|uniref:Phosphotriesterase n=1 Tax=Nocardioides panacihumi TaxID=400774 RepID=A0ABP5C1B5_9ACTN
MTATTSVNTVLGPVPAADLGVVAVHEALLSVLPGAQFAYDIELDRAAVFREVADRLTAFKSAGGGTVVDAGGMYAGRDVPLYEALSRATGVHIVASSGQMETGMLGGYFLTPQTDPPTPWPAERFAALYAAEVTEGMVVPRVERRGAAGMISTAVTADSMTPTDESQLRGCARAAKETGVALTFRAGSDPLAELAVALEEGLAAERIAVADAGEQAEKVAAAGAFVVFTDLARAVAFAQAGDAERTLVATGGAAVAFGHDVPPAAYDELVRGVPAELRQQLLVTNPAALLAVKEA